MTEHSLSEFPRRATPARSLPTVVARFIATETASGVLLVVAGVVALVWANSPFGDSYRSFWQTAINLDVGSFHLHLDFRHAVNDGLMTLFFFVVGLEIKRELVGGELSNPRVAALPVIAAIGGMVVPVVLFLVIAGSAPATSGWGVPMATDIAFALAVLALLGDRVPSSIKLIVLTFAIVDDVGAILVIALFYTDAIHLGWLALAAAGVLVTFALRRARVDWVPVYLVAAYAAWLGAYKSGVHATIAGVALALATPTRALAPVAVVDRWVDRLTQRPTGEHAHQLGIVVRSAASPAEFLEARLHPATSLVILPLFALANAGVEVHSGMLDGATPRRVFLGVVVGLVVGKLVGILGATWLGSRLGVLTLPDDAGWFDMATVAALGGIGFTVSLFVAGLAFDGRAATDAAQLGVLVASFAAATLTVVVALVAARRHRAAAD